MPIDTKTEQIISFGEARRRLPRLRNNRPVAPATIWRWTRHGVHGAKLETVLVGSTRATSVEAIDRFLAAVNGQPSPTPKQEDARQAAVERDLEALGA